MEDETLEEILATKYDINENLLAEGEFVALCGIDKEAVQLSAAGISSKSFIIATVVLSGEQKDYDLTSITSLSLIDLRIQNYAEKKISVKSQYKPTQIYQLCTGENQETKWGRFVKIIDSLQRRRNISGDHWRTVPFEASIPLSMVDMQSADSMHVTQWHPEGASCSSKSSVTKSVSETSTNATREINLSRSTSSLPERHTENFTLVNALARQGQSADELFKRRQSADELFRKRQNADDLIGSVQGTDELFRRRQSADELSADLLDITSGTSSVFSDCQNTSVLYLGSESETESFHNRSNNFLSSTDHRFADLAIIDTSLDNNSTNSRPCFLTRIYRRFFCCKKTEK